MFGIQRIQQLERAVNDGNRFDRAVLQLERDVNRLETTVLELRTEVAALGGRTKDIRREVSKAAEFTIVTNVDSAANPGWRMQTKQVAVVDVVRKILTALDLRLHYEPAQPEQIQLRLGVADERNDTV
jgi:hypothetical protein